MTGLQQLMSVATALGCRRPGPLGLPTIQPVRAPPLTTALIVLCVSLALISGFGMKEELLLPFYISERMAPTLPEIRSGQVWRLLTPVLIHFGIIHLVFNMLWLWELGGALENRLRTLDLAAMVVGLGVSSNLAQYFYQGPAFGGMSGVVFGLLGYFWMQGRFNPRFGMGLHKHIVVMMLGWFVICWLGLVGPIANMAHTAGLLLGIAWGYASARRGHP